MTLFVVPTPIGNLEDITLRALRILREVDVIAAEDTRSATRLLRHHGIAGHIESLFTGNEAEKAAALVERMTAGDSLAVISEAGTPGISDPGARLIQKCIEASIEVDVLPGACAATTALIGSGITWERFIFLGFPPRNDGERQQLFGSLVNETAAMIFYESPKRIASRLAELAEALGAERSACVGRELTKKFGEYLRGSLGQLASELDGAQVRGECTLIVAGADGDGERAAVDVESAMRELLRSGLGPKDAAARLMIKTGRSRRELYQLALSIARDLD